MRAGVKAKSTEYPWLEGGPMGELIRAHDWSRTPLGDLAGWPAGLRTAVNLMLNSRHPMWIGWGPGATFLYNDAYLSVLGPAKHPWALGRPASEVWSEIWDVCGPLADKVFAKGEASFVDDVRLFMSRGDFFEETFYSFSYSPIRDESGAVAGLFCPSAETTNNVLAARRLATLSELSARSLAEKSVASACAVAMEILGANTDDLPFAALYLADGTNLVLREATRGTAVRLPGQIAGDAAPEPFASAALQAWRGGEMQTCPVPEDWTPIGSGDQPVRLAAAIPLPSRSGGPSLGVLLAGVSPARPLDGSYAAFMRLVAAQVSSAIANAEAYESERQRAESLVALDRAKTLFFSNISHELRTPLTLLLGPIEDALKDPADSGDKERLQLMQRNARRLQRLVNTLLDFSRIEAGKAQARFMPTDLARLTADLASTFRSALERAGLRFVIDCEPLNHETLVDVRMWEQIVLNLLSNAFKFTFEGEIEIRLRAGDAGAELTVRDTGVGIAPEEMPRLFERFHRIPTSRARTHEGSGIGLAFVHELMRLHGGTISARSAPGEGTCLTLWLPYGRAHLPPERIAEAGEPVAISGVLADEALEWVQAGTPPAHDAGVTPAATRAPLGRVLIADDNADMRGYLAGILRGTFDVTAVADGAAALAAIRAQPPDLVLSDVMMPGLDGFQLVRTLREDPATSDIPLVLLSARAGAEERVEGLATGADDYIVKPFGSQELLARLKAQVKLALARREARREAETLYEVSQALGRDLDLNAVIQKITDAATSLSGAKFGAFFYNATDHTGASLMLYTLSGAKREDFERFGHPRATPIFGPTFRGEGVIRCDDVLKDPRYGKWGPHHGQPPGHLPVRSYLAVPVTSRSGEVIGGLFFGHPEPGMFDARSERIVLGIAGQAAAAMDNARLFSALNRAAVEKEQLLDSERAARAHAERMSSAKDDFLATLSHELRTPLNAIVGWSQILGRRDISGADVAQGAEVIYRNARAQAQLIDDLLDMSRVTSGKLRLEVQSVLPQSFIQAAVESMRPAAEAKEIRLHLVLDPAAGPISGDPARLQQVVWNLLSNAIKFTPKGGNVQVVLSRVNSFIEISVADDGMGIEPELLPRVWERFQQGDSSNTRRHGGLGLGLAIVRSLVEMHGGSVRALSAGHGRGSTFSISLPVSIVQEPRGERVHPQAPTRPEDLGRLNLGGLRVLVVDDDGDARALVKRLLGEHHADVHVAASGAEALELAAQDMPDVLISDIGMPEMNGYEMLRRFRAQGLMERGLKPIALTAFARSEDRTRAMMAGFLTHISKPIEPSELIATVASLTGRAGESRTAGPADPVH